MRRLIVCFVAVCSAAVLAASGAAAKKGHGTMCVLHAKLSAKNETTRSTPTAKGPTLIKGREGRTVQFKNPIFNKKHQNVRARPTPHTTARPPRPRAAGAGRFVSPCFSAPAPPRPPRHIKQSGVATPNAGTTGAGLCANPSAYYVNYHTTAFPGGAIRGQLD